MYIARDMVVEYRGMIIEVSSLLSAQIFSYQEWKIYALAMHYSTIEVLFGASYILFIEFLYACVNSEALVALLIFSDCEELGSSACGTLSVHITIIKFSLLF